MPQSHVTYGLSTFARATQSATKAPPESRHSPVSRVFALALIVVLLLHIGVVNVSSVLPWPDLPLHMALANTRATWNAPNTAWHLYFQLDRLAWRPNVGFHVFASCGLFGPVPVATRVLYTIYALSIPLLTLLIIRTLGGNPWLALLSSLLVYNYSVTFGFAEFTVALPFLLILTWLLVRWDQHGGWRCAVGAAACLLILFCCHAMAVLFAIAALGVFALQRVRRSRREALLALAACVPALVLVLGWYVRHENSTDGLNHLLTYYRRAYWVEFVQRLLDLVRADNYPLLVRRAGQFVAAFFVGSILVIGAAAARRGAAQYQGSTRRSAWSRVLTRPGAGGITAVLLAALLTVLIAPHALPPYSLIYERFMCVLLLAFIALAATAAGRCLPRWQPPVIVALCLVHVGLWMEHTWSFRHEVGDFTALVADIPPGTVVGYYAAEQSYRGAPTALLHTANLCTLAGAIPTSWFYDAAWSPVLRRAPVAVLPNQKEVDTTGPSVYTRYPNVRDVIVRGTLDGLQQAALDAVFHVVATRGAWKLYQRRAAEPAPVLPER